MSHPLRLTRARLEVLSAVEADRHTDDTPGVTFRDGYKSTTYRLWAGDGTYRTVTPIVTGLLDLGLVERQHGWAHGRGGLALTAKGRALLANREAP